MSTVQTKNSTILMVEDNRIDAKLIKLCLGRLPLSLAIEHSSTTDEAFDYIAKCCSSNQSMLTVPGLILLDLNLPGYGGHSILQEIRSKPKLKFVPVVIFSTSSFDEDIRACYEAGANSYIEKPAEFLDFRIVLERAVIYWLNTNSSASMYQTSRENFRFFGLSEE